MAPADEHHERVLAIRPLVRYVDESQAVIDIDVTVRPEQSFGDRVEAAGAPLEVHVRVTGPDGSVYDHRARLKIQNHAGTVRFEMGDPQRWWPSGMGDQALYDLTVNIVVNDDLVDKWHSTIGLTSVRPINLSPALSSDRPADSKMAISLEDEATLLVNGRQCPIRMVVPVYPADERHVLPVGEHCLLVVRGHYGPDLLYNAADRTGTLLIQSIPDIDDPGARSSVQSQVDRLAGHPSLAGWLVGPTDPVADRIANRVHELDPTRSIFRLAPES